MTKHLDRELTNRIINFMLEKNEAMSWQIQAFFGITQMTCYRQLEHLQRRNLVRKEYRKTTGNAVWFVATMTRQNGCVVPVSSAEQSTLNLPA